MVQTGDVIRVKDFQTLTNVEGDILNVYFFEVGSVTGNVPLGNIADFLEVWWYDEFLAPILAVQSIGAIHTRIEVDNMMAFLTDSVIVVPDTPYAGNVSGDYSSASAAWSFQLVRNNRTTRHGRKAIAGVPESYMGNNVASGTAPALLANAANMMQLDQTVDIGAGGTLNLIPVIAKTPTPPATLPTVFNNVIDAVYRGVGSQTTRKQLLS